MGVSGSGKSTIGVAIAAALALRFIDGDSLHSPESVRRMQSGVALTDDDRWPWLDRVGAELADATRSPAGVVVACSALKPAYRDRIRTAAPAVRFVFLDGSQRTIEARMATRSGHYMPTSLLASPRRSNDRIATNATSSRCRSSARSSRSSATPFGHWRQAHPTASKRPRASGRSRRASRR